MEEFLQDIAEFPNMSFVIGPFIIIFTLWCSYDLRPPYFPVKHWKVLAIICVSIFIFLLHCFNMDTIVFKENLNSLEQSQGILMYINPKKGQDGGYLVVDEDTKKFKWMDFMLCGHSDFIDPYLNKEVTVYHKGTIVYQMEVDSDAVFKIERSNEKVYLGNLLYFVLWMIIFSFVFAWYLLMLRTLNDNYKRSSMKCCHYF